MSSNVLESKARVPEHALDPLRICFKTHALVEINDLGVRKQCDVADALPQQMPDHLLHKCFAEPLQTYVAQSSHSILT
jgi:hypothetical protein